MSSKRGIFFAIVLVVAVKIQTISTVSQELPKVTVGTDYEGSRPMQALTDFSQVIVLPITGSPMHFFQWKVRFECMATYPIEWIYNYNQEHANYYTQNLQYSPVERFFNDSDYTNIQTFRYTAAIGISPHYNFRNASEVFTCRAVANTSLFRTVEAYYEQKAVGNGNTTVGNETTTTPVTPKLASRRAYQSFSVINENLVVRLRNISNPDYEEDPFQTGLGNQSSACPAYLVVKEELGPNPPEWRCESGTGRSDEELTVNFAYCHEGMACQNLFRTIKNQRSCVRTIAHSASLFSSSKTTSFLSPQSFEPGVAYCSSNGSIVVAQLFFYSMPPTVDGQTKDQNTSVTPTHPPVWMDSTIQDTSKEHGNAKTYNLHFNWNEVRGTDMISMPRLPHEGSVVINDRVDVICKFSVYYFALGFRIGLRYSNNSMVLRPYIYGHYEQRTNAITVLDTVPVVNKDLKGIYCLGPVWNSTEWANVSQSVSYQEPIAPKFNPNFEEVEMYTETQATMSCQSNAMPAPNTTWYRLMKDKSTPSAWEWGIDQNYFPDRSRNTEFMIHHASFPRHGFYKCVASNHAGSDTKYFKLNILPKTDYGLASLHNGAMNLTFYAGETNLSLARTHVYKGEIKAQWWWKEPLMLNDTSAIRTGDAWDFHDKVDFKDAGTYVYEVVTERGVRTTKFHVTVKAPIPPSFASDQKTTILYLGLPKKYESVSDLCPDMVGDPKPVIALNNEKTGQLFDQSKIRTDDSIRYICTASSKIGSTKVVVNIKVKKPAPPYFKNPSETIIVNLNTTKNLTINCDAEGDPVPHQINWYKNHYVLQDLETEIDNSLSTFTIQVLTKYDEGKYMCQATSDAGTAQKTFIIEIEKPNAVSELPTSKPTTTTTITAHSTTTIPTSSTTSVTGKFVGLEKPSKYAALITTTVLLALITVIGFGIFIWKIYKQRREIQELIQRDATNRPDDWYQLSAGSTANLTIPGNSL